MHETDITRGIPLEVLQQRLRPGGSSEEGFMGRDEDLLELIQSDSEVVAALGTTHQEIARALKELNLYPDFELAHAFGERTGGKQECPWNCGIDGQNVGVIIKRGVPDDERHYALSQSAGMGDLEEMLDLMRYTDDEPRIKRMIEIRDQLRQGKERFFVVLTGLLHHTIEEHHFFEGRESPYRAEPTFLIPALGLQRR